MIYIRGDTHGDISRFSNDCMPEQSEWYPDDKLIITGDFGMVFRGERNSLAERNNLDVLAKKQFEILFILGNHEGYDHLEYYPEEIRYGAPVLRIRDNIFCLQNGYIYSIENHTFFVMGGGYSRDKEWRLAYERSIGEKIWFMREMPTAEEYQRAITTLHKADMKVQYVLTHTAPGSIISQVISKEPDPNERELNDFLEWVYRKLDFRAWYFGHLHRDLQVNEKMIACFETIHCIGEDV